jgi:hypothetical protein
MLVCLQLLIKCSPCFLLTIELWPCGFTKGVLGTIEPSRWMSYLIIHESSFLFKNAPIDERHQTLTLDFEKSESCLASVPLQPRELSYCCHVHIPNKMVQVVMFTCILTREVVWRHHRAVVNRVVPLDSDHPTHNNQPIDSRWDHMIGHKTGRLYKLLGRLREFSFQSSWLSILLVKVFIVFVPCCPSPFKYQDEIFFKGRGHPVLQNP